MIDGPQDLIGLVLWVLVFPVYHFLYPLVARAFPRKATASQFHLLRRSWIAGILERREVLVAAQQTRNLTMVNSLLASSALILLGFSASMVKDRPEDAERLYLLMAILSIAFTFFATSLRHLGHFNITIGADPDVVEKEVGNPVDYFTEIISKASNRYTLGIRTFYSAFPLVFWVFHPIFFIALTAFWGAKFLFFQDFASSAPRRRT